MLSPVKASISVLLHSRSVAIVAEWWCQSPGIGIKPHPLFNGKDKMENTVQLARPNYTSPKAEETLVLGTKCAYGAFWLVSARWHACRYAWREREGELLQRKKMHPTPLQYSDALTGHTDNCVSTDKMKPMVVSEHTRKKPVMTKSW